MWIYNPEASLSVLTFENLSLRDFDQYLERKSQMKKRFLHTSENISVGAFINGTWRCHRETIVSFRCANSNTTALPRIIRFGIG